MSKALKGFMRAPLTSQVGLVVVIVYAFVALAAPVLAPFGETEIVGDQWEPWGSEFLLGTDNIGRDMLTRLIYGARNTGGMAFVITCLAFIAGGFTGMLAATLGGWIATRSGGHYATLYTHIDDFVESLRVVTPMGVSESRRLPGSGAGPSPDRLWIGSEGTLGVITEAWMRLQDRPHFRASTSVRFEGKEGFARGAEAVRTLSQSGLHPANCRLLDAGEAANSGAGDGDAAILVLGFESADHPLEAWMQRALELCRDSGGLAPEQVATREDAAATREGAGGAWRKAFLQAPYVRNALVRAACIVETFETAVTWDRFEEFHAAVTAAAHDAVQRVCGSGSVSCRFTHVYPDGPAPYYTITAPGRRGSEIEQWEEIKAAASEALLREGGTITHHHAVGRDHRPWYDQQRPDLFARSLRASKRALDPGGILNPGVLVDPGDD